MKTTEKDILLICKNWYNKELYKSKLDAFNAYYHKYYGNEDIEMSKAFALNLFLEPTIIEMSKLDHSIVNKLYEESFAERYNGEVVLTSFVDVMYERSIQALHDMPSGKLVELSQYRRPDCDNEVII